MPARSVVAQKHREGLSLCRQCDFRVRASVTVTGSARWSPLQDDDFRRSVSKPGTRLPWVFQQVFSGVPGRKNVVKRNYRHPR